MSRVLIDCAETADLRVDVVGVGYGNTTKPETYGVKLTLMRRDALTTLFMATGDARELMRQIDEAVAGAEKLKAKGGAE